MNQKLDKISELRFYLTLQLEAHLNQDWEAYEQLERQIETIEKELQPINYY